MNKEQVESRKRQLLAEKVYFSPKLVASVDSKKYRFEKLLEEIKGRKSTFVRCGMFSNYKDILESLLKDCTDEEKRLLIEIMKKVDSHNSPREHLSDIDTIQIALKSDEEKIKGLEPKAGKGYAYSYYLCQLLLSLESDEQRLRIFNENKSQLIECRSLNVNRALATIALTSHLDETKLQFLKEIKGSNNTDEKYKVQIIKSLKSDDKKLELLKEIPEQYHSEIIASLGSEELKLENLDGLSRPELVIASLSSDEKKLKFWTSLSLKGRIVVALSLDSDEKKIELLKEVGTEEYKTAIREWAKEIWEDKPDAIFEYEHEKNYYINSIKYNNSDFGEDDFEKLLLEFLQAQLIASLSCDEVKKRVIRENINILGDIQYKGYIVASYTSDEEKFAYIEDSIKNPISVSADRLFVSENQLKKVIESLSKDPESRKKESIVDTLQETLQSIDKDIRDKETQQVAESDSENSKIIVNDSIRPAFSTNYPVKKRYGPKRREKRKQEKAEYRRNLIEKGKRPISELEKELEELKKIEQNTKEVCDGFVKLVEGDLEQVK